MGTKLNVNLIHNKKNGQVNLSIPIRKLSKANKVSIKNAKKIKISIEGFE